MKTAVDSSVLLDVLGADPTFGDQSRHALRSAYDTGALVACDVVWSEVRAHFDRDDDFEEALSVLGVRFEALTAEAALTAGKLWRASRRRMSDRERVIADFLVGAHAAVQADALLTRDRGFYRRFFKINIIAPGA
ncbi:MAG: type II toxin-antitoxin system VapC family toxin [Candidatus Rokubacteria bacterium]|nr:type II toxin-antitoxin system VapC family toxin [Candidatus Rokubacteria bacterium]